MRLSAKISHSFILLFFLFPFLILLFKIRHLAFDNWYHVFMFTFLQAGASAVAALGFGLLGALGLLAIPVGRVRSGLEVVFLFPNIVPTLVVILAALNFFANFPYGLPGIVLVHVILNAGLVSVALAHLFEEKIGGFAELARVEGASRLLFMSTVLKFLRRDLSFIFLFVFAICFTSFAVPLIVGGFHGVTLEVFIYQKVRTASGWAEALSLSLLQTLMLTVLTLFLYKASTPLQSRPANLQGFAWIGGLIFPLVSTGIVITGLLGGLSVGWHQLQNLPSLSENLWSFIAGTWIVSFGVGAFVLALCILIAYHWPAPSLKNFLLGYIAPSSVITGFALLILPGRSHEWIFFKMIVGIGLITFPALYRYGWNGRLEGLSGQLQVAQTLGASPYLCFKSIIWPQLRRSAFWLSGLASFWAAGDFAFSSIVAGRELTLALVVQDLMQSYRLELAVLLVWPLLAAALVSFFCFWGIGYVFDRKSYS